MQLGSGSLVAPNVRLDHEIGRGAMGVVWTADHLALGTKVAVKILARSVLDDPTARERFALEARRIARIESEHVVRVLDFGTTGEGAPFMVMELLRGTDLAKRIDAAGPLDPRETSVILGQLCRALEAAHGQGIVHRDIKPANVFLVETGGEPFVKLLDFGVAKQSGRDLSLTQTGAAMGTPYYMSPEQFMGARDVDARADLWSVAVVVYACLTRTLPFAGETVAAISMAAHTSAFVPPSAVRVGLPETLDGWFARAFSVDRGSRFQTARELADTFNQAACLGASRVAPPAASFPARPFGNEPHPTYPPHPTHPTHPTHPAAAPLPPPMTPSTGQPPRAQPRSRLWLAAGALALLGVVIAAGGVAYLAVATGPTAARDDPSRGEDDDEDEDDVTPTPRPKKSKATASEKAPPPPEKLAPTAETAPPPEVAPPRPTAAPTSTGAPKGTEAPKAPDGVAWKKRGITCRRIDAKKTCVSCCPAGDTIAPYPSCECLFTTAK